MAIQYGLLRGIDCKNSKPPAARLNYDLDMVVTTLKVIPSHVSVNSPTIFFGSMVVSVITIAPSSSVIVSLLPDNDQEKVPEVPLM